VYGPFKATLLVIHEVLEMKVGEERVEEKAEGGTEERNSQENANIRAPRRTSVLERQ
jgi:hypothetical protein